ncbi:uncharacterized protein HMPREF1541_07161 [Cyphellophora europaea CBS 101466]|uniref:Zn(2)-C6 fungal-type domain-containing protein n=1 Tax=Cyphellophora europaea (strain CBS 101466) TaxID=1220924 RepID=W2RP91_CYPE1|nr:uncharacterized protein HMPREF1541_07161 [Cyphellophora europaea CBS 101466]ETN37539.1 hypothetical protein HMPREF1541_07161 [Cyphellophora europaea CBS 101466]
MSGQRPGHGSSENTNIPWWQSEELSPRHLPASDDTLDTFTPDFPTVFLDSPSVAANSPASFHTPYSDSYLLGPLTYDVARPIPTREAPRSMSTSAVSAPEKPLLSTSAPQLPPPRQIRFVSTDGQPHAKRRRINAACLTCRKRKTRCSGERPECKTCIDTAHVCAGYNTRPTRKGDDKFEDDSEEESGASSPKRQVRNDLASQLHQRPAPVPVPAPKLEHADSLNLPRSLSRDDADIRSPGSNHTASSTSAARHGVPYFRYFGPTAIVPGFKQMVVAVKDHRRSLPSVSGESPVSGQHLDSVSTTGIDRLPVEIPFYDSTDPSPNATLITHLCETFFTHLGCNYPFLQRERFMRDLEDKKVDAILVDAVCAVSARFSTDPTILRSNDDTILREDNGDVKRPFRGHPFAQRAMSAIVETFQFPTIAGAQASLLLAYDEFGTDHDSGLWMYLGTAIRMAQDLGIQKLQGLQFEGRIGPTPKTAKGGEEGKVEEARRAEKHRDFSRQHDLIDAKELENRKASEQERIDTFWSIFFLDRAVSSGVGRPVSLRDKDIEISFPYRPDLEMVNGYPHPFPPMIRIVHMYGRVADVLNNIKDINQVTPDVLKKLASMEKDLTGIYQRLSPKLHFNATNFQHYVKAEQGTNFILLHFWFHTLIVLVHQPTLLHSFEGRIQQLFPDSRELSMSSAKTIADILAFAELIDVKSFVGNPFTSQPMYVAACAFLAEATAHTSQPPSRTGSPPGKFRSEHVPSQNAEQRAANAKHTLLASAANQNYQRCYKALKILDSYWAGCRYILTALDQKSKGLMDPLLYTSDDIDGPMPSTEPSFTSPGWRRNTSLSASLGLSRLKAMHEQGGPWPGSPGMDWNKAIGWSLTGTANSPQPNLSFLYPNTNTERGTYSPSANDQQHSHHTQSNTYPYQHSAHMMPPPRRMSSLPYDPVSHTDADLLLNLNSPYPTASTTNLSSNNSGGVGTPTPSLSQTYSHDYAAPPPPPSHMYNPAAGGGGYPNYGDMLIESQDVDMMTVAGANALSFPGGDMIPWLEYLPQDVLSYFGEVGDGEDALAGVDGVGQAVGVAPTQQQQRPPPPPPQDPQQRGPGER